MTNVIRQQEFSLTETQSNKFAFENDYHSHLKSLIFSQASEPVHKKLNWNQTHQNQKMATLKRFYRLTFPSHKDWKKTNQLVLWDSDNYYEDPDRGETLEIKAPTTKLAKLETLGKKFNEKITPSPAIALPISTSASTNPHHPSFHTSNFGKEILSHNKIFNISNTTNALNPATEPTRHDITLQRCGCATCRGVINTNNNQGSRDYGNVIPNTDVEGYSWSGINADNDYVQGLMWGDKWGEIDPDSGNATNLKYYIYDDEITVDGGLGYEPYQEEVDAMVFAMGAYSSVANITFSEGTSEDDSHILWASLDNADSGGALGFATPPDVPSFGDTVGYTTVNWELFEDEISNGSLAKGSYYYITFTHELGHAMGLKHPHNIVNNNPLFPGVPENVSDDGGDNGLNAAPYTVMTYNDLDANIYTPESQTLYGQLETLGAFDIAAIQYLYGPNTNAGSGDTTYYLDNSTLNGYHCIWDNSGTDTISAENSDESTTIDLRNATLANEEGGGGFVSDPNSQYLGYTIAYNSTGTAVIENAIGSDFADVITGNAAANTLDGKTGADVMAGAAGDDTYIVDNSSDSITEAASAGTDSVQSSVAFTLPDNVEKLTLTGTSAINASGNSLNNTLTGNKKDNRIFGDMGQDIIDGKSGIDTAIFSAKNNTVNLGTKKRQNTKDGKDIVKNIENVSAGKGNDKITGSKKDNLLEGQAGNDVINGKKGNDVVLGGKGKDRIIWSHGVDTFTGGPSKDIFEIKKGNGYAIITDFTDKKDKIFLSSGPAKLSIENVKKDVHLYHGQDLMAIVEDAKNTLEIKGDFLI